MTDKEKHLLGACLDGEKSAWDAFVLQYAGLVYHTIKKTFSHYHTESRSDVVEDLFQDFFLSLIRKLQKAPAVQRRSGLQPGKLAQGNRHPSNY